MIALSVNVNKIAWLRNSRETENPSPLDFALSAIDCGVQGITVHPRPDLRHITPDDVFRLKNNIYQKNPRIELNIEGNPLSKKTKNYPGFLPLIQKIIPEQCTLVPDEENQKTSDHGWDLKKNFSFLKETLEKLKEWNIRSSLFLDADCSDWDLLQKLGPDRVELYTGPFAKNFGSKNEQFYWEKLLTASNKIAAMNIGLNAGHDLNLQNLVRVKKLKNLKEVSIGQALVCEALIEGWTVKIRQYLDCLK